MVFVIITGGKSKRLTGKARGRQLTSTRYRRRRRYREYKLAAERSARRQARVLDSEAASVIDRRRPREAETRGLLRDGRRHTRVTIRYNGLAVCAIRRRSLPLAPAFRASDGSRRRKPSGVFRGTSVMNTTKVFPRRKP